MTALDGIAIVTGAGSGIGRECALGFAFAGAAGVVFADRNLPAAEKAAEESRRIANNNEEYCPLAIQVDVADGQSVEEMLAQTLEKFGRVDYCVNAAGVCSISMPFIIEYKLTDLDCHAQTTQYP